MKVFIVKIDDTILRELREDVHDPPNDDAELIEKALKRLSYSYGSINVLKIGEVE